MRWAQLDTAYPEEFITTGQIGNYLDLIEKGMGLNPNDMKPWMDEVSDDVQMAREHEALENENEPESPELAIIAAASQENIGMGLGEVLKWFDLGDHLTQCKPTSETTDIQIGRGIEVLAGVRNWTELGLGDLLNALEDRGHEGLIPQIISQLGIEDSYQTIRKYQTTARAVPNELRELPNLKYSHLAEAATSKFSDDPEEQATAIREVLTEASTKALNVTQTREACLNRKGKTTKPTPPPEPKKPGFIMIDKEALLRGDIVIRSSFKEPLCNEYALCISIENMDYATECRGEALHAWMGIPIEDEPEGAAAGTFAAGPEVEDEVTLVNEK